MASPAEEFGLVFGVIFAAEFADRTMFAVLSMASRWSPREVWAGASAAFLGATGVGVALGYAFVTLLPRELLWIRIASGVLLIGFAVREFRLGRVSEESGAEETRPGGMGALPVGLRAFLAIFLLEMGDNTQILVVSFVADLGASPPLGAVVTIYAGAVAALIGVAALATSIGRVLRGWVAPDRMRLFTGGVLLVVGALTIALAVLHPG